MAGIERALAEAVGTDGVGRSEVVGKAGEQLEHKGAWRAVPLLLLLLQRPLGVLLVEPHALERSLLGGSAAVEVKAGVGELLEELGLQHRQADDACSTGSNRSCSSFSPTRAMAFPVSPGMTNTCSNVQQPSTACSAAWMLYA
jgi:hypothetical protein